MLVFHHISVSWQVNVFHLFIFYFSFISINEHYF